MVEQHGATRLERMQADEWRLEQALDSAFAASGLPCVVASAEHFLLERDEAAAKFAKKVPRMEFFYRDLRRRFGILVEPDNFAAAFNGAHGYTVDYRSGCQELYIKDVTNRTVSYVDVDGKEQILTAGVLNPIPPQRAPQWLADAGLYDPDAGERSIPVSVLSYESTRVPLVHVIGDASLTTQPKAGHIGNQQAKTCADAILRSLQNQPLDQAPVTNSACYTPITATTATWLSAVYQYDAKTGTMFIPSQHNGGSAISTSEATTDNYEDMQVWFKTLMADTFT